ncbi:MAG: universal stress protein [Betaproteobacteria bacterium]|nr:universal stress protein [Betaproteobacteria bacterium]
MKRILVPVDGSEAAERALRLAAQRARESQAEVHLLHVEPPAAAEELRAYAVRPELEKMRESASARVLKEAADALAAEKVPHTAHLQRGEVARTIARFTAAHDIGEVIMGTRGMGALGSMLLGSVAQRVVHEVAVPVTLVK